MGLTILALLLGCPHPTQAKLALPLRLWNHDSGLCGEQWAIDGQGVLWREGGCENGVPRFHRVRRLTADETRRVADLFAALPLEPSKTAAQCGGPVHIFTLDTDAGADVWVSCEVPGTGGGPEAAYLELARTLDNMDR